MARNDDLREFRMKKVETEGPFLRVEGYDKISIHEISKALGLLRDRFDAAPPFNFIEDLHQNGQMLVVRPQKSDRWFRCRNAKIIDYERKLVQVEMMDFGVEGTYPLANLREIKNHQEYFQSMPAQYVTVYMHGIAAQDWSKGGKDVIKYLQPVLTDASAVIKSEVMFEYNQKKFLRFLINGASLDELILAGGFGDKTDSSSLRRIAAQVWPISDSKDLALMKVTSPSPDFGKSSRRSSTSPFSSPSPGLQVQKKDVPRVHLAEDIQLATIASAPTPSFPNQMYPPNVVASYHQYPVVTSDPKLLPANVEHLVKVTLVEDGPQAFYVNVIDKQPMLQELTKSLQTLPLTPVTFATEGMLCAVKYNEKVYRCLLIICGGITKVRLIDYGHLVDVKLSDVFSLPSQLMMVNQFAFRFCMRGVLGNPDLCNNPDVNNKFKQIVGNSACIRLNVVPADGPPTGQYCELFTADNKKVVDLLIIEANKPLCYPSKTLNPNTDYEVVVSFVDTGSEKIPWAFYVQLVFELERLENCSCSFNKYCSDASAPDASKLKDNYPVLAKYDVDDKWYRGLITQLMKDKATVFFVDYGNTEQVLLENLRMPTRSIVEMPSQAIKCLMDGVSTNLKARAILDSKAADKEFILKFSFNVDGVPVVRMVEKGSEDKMSLNDKIVIDSLSLGTPNLPDLTRPPPVKMPNGSPELQRNDFDGTRANKPEKGVYLVPLGNMKQLTDANSPRSISVPNIFSPPKPTFHFEGMNRSRRDSSDEPDCSNRKRNSSGVDEWASKRMSHQPPRQIVDPSELSLIQPKAAGSPSGNWSPQKTRNGSGDGRSDSSHGREIRGASFNKPANQQMQPAGDSQSLGYGKDSSFSKGSSPGQNFGFGSASMGFNGNMATARSTGFERNAGSNNSGVRNDTGFGNKATGPAGNSTGFRNSSSGFGAKKVQDEGNTFPSRNHSGDDFSQSRRGSWNSNSSDKGRAPPSGFNTGKSQGNFRSNMNSSFNLTSKSGQTAAVSNGSESWDDATATPAIAMIKKISPYPVKIGEKLKCLMVFSSNPNDFYLQPQGRIGEIETITDSVTEEFQSSPVSALTLVEGESCWAKFTEDDAWYRATVTEKVEKSYKVVFVDYGNSNEVSESGVRPMKEEHSSLPAQCFNCALRGVEKTDWTPEEADSFFCSTSESELEVLVVAKAKEKYSVALFKGDDCINTNFGATNESLAPKSKVPNQSLAVDSSHSNMSLSWIRDPTAMSLHRSDSCESLKDAIDVQEDKLPRLPLSEPQIGTLVHIEVNKKLVRGVVVAIRGPKCKVELIDYGKIVISSVEKLNAMPEEFVLFPKQAIVCCLRDVKPVEGKGWPSIGSNNQFDGIFLECKTFTITIKTLLENGRLEVDMLRDDGLDVSNLLRERGFAAPKPEPVVAPQAVAKELEKALPGAEWKVFVSLFRKNSNFYVHKAADQEQIELLLEKLQQLAGDVLTEVEIGEVIAARNPEDELWYRGLVVQKDPILVVSMMDYGNLAEVTEMKTLPQDLASIPPYATSCYLPVIPADGENHLSLQTRLEEELFQETALTMSIIAVADKYLVVDFKLEHSTLIEKLFMDALALKSIDEGFVSNITSLEDFDFQDVSCAEKIGVIEEALLEKDTFPVLENYKLGDKCLAEFTDDNVLYRAEITSLENGKVKVWFYDYGNSAEATDLRQMTEELLSVKKLSQQFKMFDIPESEAIREKILDIVHTGANESVQFQFLKLSAGDSPCEVVVFKDGIDVVKLASPGMNILATEFTPKYLQSLIPQLVKVTEEVTDMLAEPVASVTLELAMTNSETLKMESSEILVENTQINDNESAEPEKLKDTGENQTSATDTSLDCNTASIKANDSSATEEGALDMEVSKTGETAEDPLELKNEEKMAMVAEAIAIGKEDEPKNPAETSMDVQQDVAEAETKINISDEIVAENKKEDLEKTNLESEMIDAGENGIALETEIKLAIPVCETGDSAEEELVAAVETEIIHKTEMMAEENEEILQPTDATLTSVGDEYHSAEETLPAVETGPVVPVEAEMERNVEEKDVLVKSEPEELPLDGKREDLEETKSESPFHASEPEDLGETKSESPVQTSETEDSGEIKSESPVRASEPEMQCVAAAGLDLLVAAAETYRALKEEMAQVEEKETAEEVEFQETNHEMQKIAEEFTLGTDIEATKSVGSDCGQKVKLEAMSSEELDDALEESSAPLLDESNSTPLEPVEDEEKPEAEIEGMDESLLMDELLEAVSRDVENLTEFTFKAPFSVELQPQGRPASPASSDMSLDECVQFTYIQPLVSAGAEQAFADEEPDGDKVLAKKVDLKSQCSATADDAGQDMKEERHAEEI